MHPLDTLRDGNRRPQRRRETFKRVAPLPAAVEADLFDVEAREIPVPALRERGRGPVRGVEDDVGGGEAELERGLGIGEEDDGEHEEERGGEGDEAVGGGADAVGAFFRVPVELAGDVLVALDDHEGALRVGNDDVAEGDGARGFALFELKGPAGADADDGAQDGEEEDGEEGHAVPLLDGNADDCEGHGAAEDGKPSQRTVEGGFHGGAIRVHGDAFAADGVGGEVVAIV